MEWQGRFALGLRISGAMARMVADRAEEGRGRALPRTSQQIVDLDVLNGLIAEHAESNTSGVAPLPPIASAWLPGVEFESSNCTNFLIEVEFEGSPQGLPRTLYVKLPCSEIATRAFANAVGFWEVETTFCQRVASKLPIRVPRVHAAVMQGTRFVLILENLYETPGTQLFNNRDMAAGTTLDRAKMCLQTLAELHAGFWNWSESDRDALLPPRLHTYLSDGGRRLTKTLADASIGPARRVAPDLFSESDAALCRQAVEKWDALVDFWYGGALTLIHGDSHLANFFEYPGPDGPTMGMLDFQGMHWCQGIRDIQYFLINSIEPDQLAGHEDELIEFYLSELSKRGIRLEFEEAKEQYRAFSFQTLMVAVTSIGLGGLTERDETVRTVLRRSVAAIDRLGFGAWLERL